MYKLPESLRADLARPIAKVLTTEEAVRVATGKLLVAVGDVCSERFVEAGLVPHLIVADWKTQRHADLARFRERARQDPDVLWLKVPNPAGTITEELWEAIVSGIAADRRALIEVDGEEDLAALPAILLAPEGASRTMPAPCPAAANAAQRHARRGQCQPRAISATASPGRPIIQ